MSKKNFLEQIGDVLLLYQFRWIILIEIILLGATSDLENILKLLFKGMYREQNGLKPDYGN